MNTKLKFSTISTVNLGGHVNLSPKYCSGITPYTCTCMYVCVGETFTRLLNVKFEKKAYFDKRSYTCTCTCLEKYIVETN